MPILEPHPRSVKRKQIDIYNNLVIEPLATQLQCCSAPEYSVHCGQDRVVRNYRDCRMAHS